MDTLVVLWCCEASDLAHSRARWSHRENLASPLRCLGVVFVGAASLSSFIISYSISSADAKHKRHQHHTGQPHRESFIAPPTLGERQAHRDLKFGPSLSYFPFFCSILRKALIFCCMASDASISQRRLTQQLEHLPSTLHSPTFSLLL